MLLGPLSAAQTKEEVVLWLSIKDSTRVGDFLAYLDSYPKGTFVALASQRLRELTQVRSHRYAASFAVMEPRYTDLTHSACVLPPHPVTDVRLNAHPILLYLELDGLRPGDELLVELSPPGDPPSAPGMPIENEMVPQDISDVACYRISSGFDFTRRGSWVFSVQVNRQDKGGITIDVK